MAEIPDYSRNIYDDDDGDIDIDCASVNNDVIATEPLTSEPILIQRNSEATKSQASYADNPYNTPPSFNLAQSTALDNPLKRLLEYESDDESINDIAELNNFPSCPVAPSNFSTEVAPHVTPSSGNSLTPNSNGSTNPLFEATSSYPPMDVAVESRPTERSSINTDTVNALDVARTAFITQESYGIPEFLAVIEQHTAAGSEERVQWTRHVDALGEALRESETLPDAPAHFQRHPTPELQRPQVPGPRIRRKVVDHINPFLDIEAIDDEDGDESEGEAGNTDSFIDDDAVLQSSSMQRISFPSLGQASNAAFLDHLEETYVHRASEDLANGGDSQMIDEDDEVSDNTVDDLLYLNSRDRDWVEQIFPEVSHESDDWCLFGVKCKVGSEYGILYDILHTPALESEVRSAFINPSVGNYLYVEAQLPQFDSELFFFLSNRSDIQINTMKIVALEDHKSCLWVRPRQKTIFLEGTWVQINTPGLYQGDVGLVRGLKATPARSSICVLVVPRLHRFSDPDETDNATRPPLELVLDTTLERAMLEQPAIEKHTPDNDAPYFLWSNWTFQSGLLVDYFPPASLTVANTISTANRALLLESAHPNVLARQNSLPLPESWKFEEGEVVSVLDAATDLLTDHPDGVIRAVLSQSCEVDIERDGGHMELEAIPMERLVKKHTPGDYVKVVGGYHAGTTGMVGERNGRVLGLIVDNSYSVNIWVDVNSVVSETSTTSLALTNTPWRDIEVVITKYELGSPMKGKIKRAWPDGHGSVRLLVYVPLSQCSVELDYTQVLQSPSLQSLENLVLDTKNSVTFFDYFHIDRTLHRMKTGPEPWIGVRVLVVQGPWHGISGTVREVNKYLLDARKNPRASGVSLIVELDIATTNVVNPRVKLDYDDKGYRTHQLLQLAIPTTSRQSFFAPNPGFSASKFAASRSDAPSARPSTPLYDPDSVKSMYEFVGQWYPGPAVERPSAFASSSYPNASESYHFLFHRSLFGIPIRVDIDGGVYDTLRTKAGERYVIPTPCDDGSILLKIDVPKAKVGETFVHSSAVLKHRDRPKPSTEKRLMVVVGGKDEDIGKLVRQLHYFFKGSKSDANKWFILAVVHFSAGEEIVTEEKLELHPNDVEYVRESKEIRKKSRQMLAIQRELLAHSNPEIRL
ncbi:hypothetical protein C8R42DRAFT_725898 [Lentinula raphanica]|nr:hypothetical protein C8R42DRAFT_725898 [Lentinula raphanica]